MMIVFLATIIYLPSLFVHPTYNFLYSTNQGYYSRNVYVVENNRLVIRSDSYTNSYTTDTSEPRLFIYDVTTNQNREVPLLEAQQLRLVSNPLSPDGFIINHGSRGEGFFPFFFYSGTDYNTLFITGHNVSKKLAIPLTSNYYDSFKFIGWITP
jgi:hypothetical protein